MNTITIDPTDPALIEALSNAPIYRKNVTVKARPADGAPVTTVLASGETETVRPTILGEWVVTNPAGEEYSIPGETFTARYEPTAQPGVFRAVGRARMMPHGRPGRVSMVVPWGVMGGGPDALVAVTVDGEGVPDGDPYLIGADESAGTYVPDAG